MWNTENITWICQLLVLCRVSAFFYTNLFFNGASIPQLAKLALILSLSYFIAPLASETIPLEAMQDQCLLYILNELMVGWMLGWSFSLTFYAIQEAGGLIDMFAGLQNAAAYNALTKVSQAMYGKLYYWLGLIIFLMVNGHHLLIRGIVTSYDFFQLGQTVPRDEITPYVVNLIAYFFEFTIQISFPFCVLAMLIDMVLGLMNRAVSQINVFILGMPLKLLVSVIFFSVVIAQVVTGLFHVLESGMMPFNRLF